MKKKKILFIHNAEKFGGSAKSLFQLILILMQKDYECIVLLRERDEGSEYFEKNGIRVISYPFLFQVGFTISDLRKMRARIFRPFRLLLSLPGVIFWSIKLNPDIFHINDITLGYLCLILRFFNKPIIVHRRTLFHSNTNLRFNINAYAITKYADRVISICKSYNIQQDFLSNARNKQRKSILNNKLVKYNPELRPPSNLNIIIHDPEVNQKEANIYKNPFLKFIKNYRLESKKKVLFIGSMGYRSQYIKGIGIFEEAIKIIETSNRDDIIGFVIGGGKQEKPSLINNIVYVGTTTDVNFYYKIASLLVVPFIVDHCSRQIFEGFRNRVPVICSDLPCLSELVTDNETGFLVEPRNPEALASKILSVIDDEETLSRIKHNAFDFFQKIQNESREKTIQLFDSLLNQVL